MFLQPLSDRRNLATDPVQIELSPNRYGADAHTDLAAPDTADLTTSKVFEKLAALCFSDGSP